MGEAVLKPEPPHGHAQFASEPEPSLDKTPASYKPARRPSYLKPALIAFASYSLVVVVAGLARKSANSSKNEAILDRYFSEEPTYYQEEYFVPTPSYPYQSSYSAPTNTTYPPSTPFYSPVAPSYTPQSGYAGGLSQYEYGMRQTDWSRTYP
jgi:hypothetical protein